MSEKYHVEVAMEGESDLPTEEPRLKIDPKKLSRIIVTHADIRDLRTETYVRGDDDQFHLESVVRY